MWWFSHPWRIAVVLLVVFAWMGIEAAVASRNERAQRARGGIEPPGDVYAWMRIAYPGAFLLMALEATWTWFGAASTLDEGAAVAVAWPAVTGLAIFAAAKALKWWAIVSLGRAWTFRVIVVPGSTLVRSGPYRLMSHPNYVGVIGELVGVALVLGGVWTGWIATLGFGWLIVGRLRVERAALATLVR